MQESNELDVMVLHPEEMHLVLGGLYGDCITCTPKGNHTDANDDDTGTPPDDF